MRTRALVSALLWLASCSSDGAMSADGGQAVDRTDAADGDHDAGATVRASAGCASTAAYPPGTTLAMLTHGGAMRSFRVHVPPGHRNDAPSAVVVMLHGGGGSGRQFEQASSRMDAVADREGFVAVYPDGSGVLRTWNGGGCCGYAVENDVDDVGFITALLDHLEGALCVDQDRIFASGMSNGAIMAHRLACELSDRIAAIAPVAGTDLTRGCAPVRVVPVLQIHGTADGHVPWDGGQGCGPANVPFTSVPETMERWRMRDGCTGATTSYFAEGDGTCEAYGGCAAGSDVVLCSIEGGGHSWPGGEPPADLVECPGNGPQSATFHASDAIWRFFSSHPMAAR